MCVCVRVRMCARVYVPVSLCVYVCVHVHAYIRVCQVYEHVDPGQSWVLSVDTVHAPCF